MEASSRPLDDDRKPSLAHRRRSHTTSSKCDVCSRRFVYARALDKHMFTKHRGYMQVRKRLLMHPPGTTNTTGKDLDAQNSTVLDAIQDSDGEEESDSEDDDQDEDLNPEEGEINGRRIYTDTDAAKVYEEDPTQPPEDDSSPSDNPWEPFESAEDYHLAQWFVDHQITNAAIEDYFALTKRFPGKFYQGHFTSSYTLFKVIDKMTHGFGWSSWQSGTVNQRLPEDRVGIEREKAGIRSPDTGYSTFYYRNPLQCIRFLLSQERLKDVTVYEPYKDMHMTTREVEEGGMRRKLVEETRIYSEMHTADWWWDAQHTIPRGGTLIPILASSDQSHLTNYSGDKKMWPVFLTIGNILSTTRSKPSEMCNILLALLPIPPKYTATGKGKTAKDARQRALCREALRQVMEIILRPLKDASKDGKLMKCPDGATRLCFPRIACWLADHVENVTLHSIKSTSCAICEAPRSSFSDLPGVLHTTRDGRVYLDHLLKYEANPRDSTSKDYLTNRDVKLIEGCFWQFPPEMVDLRTLPRPDMLHTIFLGIFKHLMEWIVKFLEAHDRMHHFNLVWRQMPSFPGFKRFNKDYTAASQWTGKEMRNLGRVLLPVLAAALRNPKDTSERQHFKDALKCVKGLIDFHLILQYTSHDKHTIDRARAVLDDFHRYKDVFLLYRAGKATSADAASLRTSLLKKSEAMRKTDPIFKRLSKAAKQRKINSDKEDIEAQVAAHVRNRTSFDFVKMHYLLHFIDHVPLFGNAQPFATELLEASHKDLKDGFRASNKINAAQQILVHISRRQSFDIHRLHQQHFVEQLSKANPVLDGPLEPAPRRLQGKLSPKIVKTIQDIAVECGNISADYIKEMVANYFAHYLKDRTKYEEDEHKHILDWKATGYNTLSIPVTVFGTVDEQKRMPVRCTGERPWRSIYPPRKDLVFVWMDNISLYGALQGRLPARLRSLFKTVDPTDESTHRLAIVETFEPEDGGAIGEAHGLVTVKFKTARDELQRVNRGAGRSFIVPIRKVLGPAHLIPYEPHEGNTKWFVNSTIDLETYNAIY